MPLPRGKDVPSGRTGNYDRRRLEVCLFRKVEALTLLFWGHAGIAKPFAAFGCAIARLHCRHLGPLPIFRILD